jgi:hypothetical protein
MTGVNDDVRSTVPSSAKRSPDDLHRKVDSANDSLPLGGRVTRVSAAKAAQIVSSLSETDRSIIATLQTVRLATGKQLRRLHFKGDASGARLGRRRLARLTEQRVLARLGRAIGGQRAGSDGFVYALDAVGQRLTAPERRRRWRPHTPGQPYLAHAIAVTECYVLLAEPIASHNTELLRFDGEPRAWRDFHGPGGSRLTLKPDAYIRVGVGEFEDRWFLEIDRATEEPARVRAKAQLYVRYRQTGREEARFGQPFPRVLWVVPDQRRVEQVTAALSQLDAEDWQLFGVCRAETFADTIAAGAGRGSIAGGGEPWTN